MFENATNNTNEKAAAKKRWDKKVITTSNQWNFNAFGSKAVDCYSTSALYDAIAEYKRDLAEW